MTAYEMAFGHTSLWHTQTICRFTLLLDGVILGLIRFGGQGDAADSRFQPFSLILPAD